MLLAGGAVGGAEAAAAADGELALGVIFRAYLSLYAMTAQGAAEASTLVTPAVTEPAGAAPRPLAPRERHHLAAARAWADGDWQAAARALERALLALKVAQYP